MIRGANRDVDKLASQLTMKAAPSIRPSVKLCAASAARFRYLVEKRPHLIGKLLCFDGLVVEKRDHRHVGPPPGARHASGRLG